MQRRAFLLAPIALGLAACGAPPEIPNAYIGDWRAENMRLAISPDGMVRYERKEGQKSSSVNAPIKKFEGDNFIVGVGPFTTTFVVSKPPRNVDGAWKMTVDGVELVRNGGSPGDLKA